MSQIESQRSSGFSPGEFSLRSSGAAPSSIQPASRVAALDVTKGALVICMVLYHSLNYSSDYALAFKYLAFLPPSFILITGFLISGVYLSRTNVQLLPLFQRLFIRGAKLLILFTVLNLVAQSVRRQNLLGQPINGLDQFMSNLFEIYILGDGRLAAFEVLVPIAYLLMLSPPLVVIERFNRFVVPAATIVVVGLLVWVERLGETFHNANLLSAGLVGIALGRLSFERLNRLASFWPVGILAYGLYFVTGILHGQTYLVQLLGAVIALAMFYLLAVRFGNNGWLQCRFEILGRYSLLAYIAQIGFLQVLARLAGRPDPTSFRFLALFLTAMVLTALVTEFAEYVRKKSPPLDSAYRFVFA